MHIPIIWRESAGTSFVPVVVVPSVTPEVTYNTILADLDRIEAVDPEVAAFFAGLALCAMGKVNFLAVVE